MSWEQFLFESKSYNCCLKDFEMIKCSLLFCLLLSMELVDNKNWCLGTAWLLPFRM